MTQNENDSLKSILPMMRRVTSCSCDTQTHQGKEISGIGSGDISAWWHPASSVDTRPVLFELHGGGFALGDVRKGDALRTWISYRWDVHVIGVDYRLAPENPWPAALTDTLETLEHFAEHADEYRMDSQQFYLVGYSAGANLSLATCFKLQDLPTELFSIKACALHYPFLDAAVDPALLPSTKQDIPAEMMRAFNNWYVTDNDPKNPFISPLFASDEVLAKLPFVTLYPAVGDALYGSAEAFHKRLVQVGASCAFHPVEGVYHGYIEDAENLEVYRATSLPESMAAHPAEFPQMAARTLQESLDEILGVAACEVAFNPETAQEDAQRFAAGRKQD